MGPDDYGRIERPDRSEWRRWLEENHAGAPGVWVVYAKKGSGLTGLSYDDAVEEALCFGWIDSKVNSLDEQRYMQLFTPRRPGSVWSRLNKERIARVIDAGLMADAGMARIRDAEADGSWSLLDDIDELVVPEDLRAALEADPGAAANFEGFTPSQKKPLLFWIASAKRPATRQKRIAEVVRRAKEDTPFGE